MKTLIWLLFLPGFLCNPNPLRIQPNSLVAWKGSCVLIPCQIGQYKGTVLRDLSLLWYFQPFYDINRSDYSGQLLYNSAAASSSYRTRSQSAFADRLKFVGNLERRTCNLKISQLRAEDNGIYGARLYASYGRPVQKNKWFLNATVNVAESPPEPRMDIFPKEIREGQMDVTCSVPYHCLDEPLRLTISGLGSRLSSRPTTMKDGVIKTVVSFQVTWEDHGKSLVCSLLKTRDGSAISKSTMQLDVKYAPKDVRVTASPGKTVLEGETLSLECTINSSNPEVSEYLWYKNDRLMHEQPKLKRIDYEVEGDQHSGAYRCQAKNSVGSQTSEEVFINVQSRFQDPSAPSTSGLEPTTESEGAQSSPSSPFTYEHVSSPLPSMSCPPSLSERPPSQAPLPSSQTPCDGRTLWEEFSFLKESQDQAVKAQNQFIHSCKELTSSVVQLAEKFQQALLQIKQRICVIPSEEKEP